MLPIDISDNNTSLIQLFFFWYVSKMMRRKIHFSRAENIFPRSVITTSFPMTEKSSRQKFALRMARESERNGKSIFQGNFQTFHRKGFLLPSAAHASRQGKCFCFHLVAWTWRLNRTGRIRLEVAQQQTLGKYSGELGGERWKDELLTFNLRHLWLAPPPPGLAALLDVLLRGKVKMKLT